jgi:hypothetical protein
MDIPGIDGAACAAEIDSAGWRQCSVFRPPQQALDVLPSHVSLQDGEWLVVCTQSCSVCSANFDKEPLVEVVVGEPLLTYNPRHSDAQGKSSHTFHLPLNGLPRAEALVCRLGRRAFIQRALLRQWTPERTWVAQGSLDAFKGWLANYYMRVALPNELVARLREPGGIHGTVKKALGAEVNGRKAEEGVTSFWIQWSTDEEPPPDRLYEISLLAACHDEDVQEFLDRELADLQGRRSASLSVNRVVVRDLVIKTVDNTTLADLKGMSRFNEWDEMSSLPERLASMRSGA